jgi:hypothetical protein
MAQEIVTWPLHVIAFCEAIIQTLIIAPARKRWSSCPYSDKWFSFTVPSKGAYYTWLESIGK